GDVDESLPRGPEAAAAGRTSNHVGDLRVGVALAEEAGPAAPRAEGGLGEGLDHDRGQVPEGGGRGGGVSRGQPLEASLVDGAHAGGHDRLDQAVAGAEVVL